MRAAHHWRLRICIAIIVLYLYLYYILLFICICICICASCVARLWRGIFLYLCLYFCNCSACVARLWRRHFDVCILYLRRARCARARPRRCPPVRARDGGTATSLIPSPAAAAGTSAPRSCPRSRRWCCSCFRRRARPSRSTAGARRCGYAQAVARARRCASPVCVASLCESRVCLTGCAFRVCARSRAIRIWAPPPQLRVPLGCDCAFRLCAQLRVPLVQYVRL